ncbi:MAG TPA: DUF1576 domain-containing protein, partial [Sphaerochaeta sp.]|nr:DUF1576 domain-containing protein [Sphaerochaeta sp.]
LTIVFFATISLSGPTIAAIFTMIGFGFFGKTPLNILPLIAGVWIAAKIANNTLGSYSLIALFGTALGPVVTFIMFEMGLPLILSIPLGVISGLVAGFILPGVAGTMLQLHQGYNLYNTGFSCGFIGLFASGLLIATNKMEPITIIWNTVAEPGLYLLIPILSAFLIISAVVIDGFSNIRETLKGLIDLQKLPGRLPTDMFDAESAGSTLINMGLLGLGSSLYVWIVKAPFNGPVIGGILTIMGFGGFGKTLKNVWPVVVGVVLATLVFGKDLSAPGPILAALFCTTLAPIAGQFGILAGIVAGFIHLFMVETTAAWHGGLDLYNNGFAGGLTASLMMAVMQWYRTNRPKEDFQL